MHIAEIINRIIEKLGGNRVKFQTVRVGSYESIVQFWFAHNTYRCGWNDEREIFLVERLVIDTFVFDTYSHWVQNVLNGFVRDDAGNMVPA